jgi:hypothetical protein
MDVIKPPTQDFDFKQITLANPEPLQNGSYFTKISLGDNKPLILQMPRCNTKQGLVDIKGTKYCDLMYERSANEDLMNWLEQLEYSSQDKLDEKKELWFQTELTRDDIESMMAPIMRVYQSGKYVLIRTSLNSQKTNGMEKSIAYNEQETLLDLEKLDQIDSIIPLVIINGIKFSSKSFEIDIRLLQMMVFNKPVESPCLIKYHIEPLKGKSLEITNLRENKITLDKNKQLLQDKTLVQDKSIIVEKPILVEKPLVQEKSIIVEKPLVQQKNIMADKPLQGTQLVKERFIIAEKSLQNKQLEPSLEEVSINYETLSDSISLKNPNEVYYEIYKAARIKAKQLRKVAMEAYLEAKEIKTKYMLTDFDDSSDSESESEEDDT